MPASKSFCKRLVLIVSFGLLTFGFTNTKADDESDTFTVAPACASTAIKVQEMYLDVAHTCRAAYHKAHSECLTHTTAATTPNDLAGLCDTPYNTAHSTCKAAYLDVHERVQKAVGSE